MLSDISIHRSMQALQGLGYTCQSQQISHASLAWAGLPHCDDPLKRRRLSGIKWAAPNSLRNLPRATHGLSLVGCCLLARWDPIDRLFRHFPPLLFLSINTTWPPLPKSLKRESSSRTVSSKPSSESSCQSSPSLAQHTSLD